MKRFEHQHRRAPERKEQDRLHLLDLVLNNRQGIRLHDLEALQMAQTACTLGHVTGDICYWLTNENLTRKRELGVWWIYPGPELLAECDLAGASSE